MPSEPGTDLLETDIPAVEENCSYNTPVTVEFIVINDHVLAGNQACEVFLGFITKGLASFRRINTLQSYFMLNLSVAENHDGIAIGYTNDSA